MDQQERIAIAAKLLVQSPPGEINDVLNDIRTIIDDDETLQLGISDTLEQYNLEQFVAVEVPGSNHQVIISDVSRIGEPGENRFLDPRSKQSFVFDHLRLEASDPRDESVDQDAEPFRSALETAAQKHLDGHFRDGIASVFAVSTSKFVIQIVANKYNPSNFWSGRWRSRYEIDLDNKTATGSIQINVHYYEQGNVQLQTTFAPELTLPPSAPSPQAAKQLLTQIAERENQYQTTLSHTYDDLGEKNFKLLRRALPLTRNKVDWDKVTGYKLGAELQSSRGGFGGS